MESRPKKLLDQVRDAIRVKHYARNTEQAYVYWINRNVLSQELGVYSLDAQRTDGTSETHTLGESGVAHSLNQEATR